MQGVNRGCEASQEPFAQSILFYRIEDGDEIEEFVEAEVSKLVVLEADKKIVNWVEDQVLIGQYS